MAYISEVGTILKFVCDQNAKKRTLKQGACLMLTVKEIGEPSVQLHMARYDVLAIKYSKRCFNIP